MRLRWSLGSALPRKLVRSLEHVLDSRWKGLFLEMEGFSDSPLERDELRDFEVHPTPHCGNQSGRLNPIGNLAQGPSLLSSKGTRHNAGTLGSSLRVAVLLLLKLSDLHWLSPGE